MITMENRRMKRKITTIVDKIITLSLTVRNRVRYHGRYIYLFLSRDSRNRFLSKSWDEIIKVHMTEILSDRYYFGFDKGVMLHNNRWGINKLKGGKYEQSIFVSLTQNRVNQKVAWTHNPKLNSKGVLGYPGVLIGAGGFGGKSTVPAFPVQISEIETLRVNYKANIKNDNMKFNLAFDFWICDKLSGKRLAEIMIWEDYNIAKPFGKRKKDFGDYKVNSGYMKRPDVGENEGWEFIAFVRKERLKRREGVVDVGAVLRWILVNGLLPAEYIHDDLMGVELGTEVYNSTGVVSLEFFEMQLTTNPYLK